MLIRQLRKTRKAPLADDVLTVIGQYRVHRERVPHAYLPYREIVQLVVQLRGGVNPAVLFSNDPEERPPRVPVPRSLSASLSYTMRRMAREGKVRLRFTRKGQISSVRELPSKLAELEESPKQAKSLAVALGHLNQLRPTYREMGRALGVSPSTVQGWVVNRTSPKDKEETLRKITEYLALASPRRRRRFGL